MKDILYILKLFGIAVALLLISISALVFVLSFFFRPIGSRIELPNGWVIGSEAYSDYVLAPPIGRFPDELPGQYWLGPDVTHYAVDGTMVYVRVLAAGQNRTFAVDTGTGRIVESTVPSGLVLAPVSP